MGLSGLRDGGLRILFARNCSVGKAGPGKGARQQRRLRHLRGGSVILPVGLPSAGGQGARVP